MGWWNKFKHAHRPIMYGVYFECTFTSIVMNRHALQANVRGNNWYGVREHKQYSNSQSLTSHTFMHGYHTSVLSTFEETVLMVTLQLLFEFCMLLIRFRTKCILNVCNNCRYTVRPEWRNHWSCWWPSHDTFYLNEWWTMGQHVFLWLHHDEILLAANTDTKEQPCARIVHISLNVVRWVCDTHHPLTHLVACLHTPH